MLQLLDASGQVLIASPELVGRGPITTLRPEPGETEREQQPIARENDPFQVVAVGVTTTEGPRIVVVAGSLRPVRESVEFLTGSVAVGIPLLAAVVGLATYLFVGRSLLPVEAIRRQVASVSGHDLTARVPDTGDPGRGGGAGRDDERDAGPARVLGPGPAAVRGRREPRAAQPP